MSFDRNLDGTMSILQRLLPGRYIDYEFLGIKEVSVCWWQS